MSTKNTLPAIAALFLLGFCACAPGQLSLTDGTTGDVGGGTEMPGPGGTTDTDGTTSLPPPMPYEAPAPQVSLRKVKQLVCGGATTSAEETAYLQNANVLPDLVAEWMKTDDYREILHQFFSDQFQQSQALAGDFKSLNDGSPVNEAENSARNSFARTTMALIDEGRPFSETMTTRRFMMTSALMSYYARADTGRNSDGKGKSKRTMRWRVRDPNFGPSLQKAAGPVSLSDAANPDGPHWLQFYAENVDTLFDKASPLCRIDPIIFTPVRTVDGESRWPWRVYDIVRGADTQIWAPSPANKREVLCNGARPKPSIFTAEDGNDWRMVEVRNPRAGEKLTEFFDMPRIRNSNVLLIEGERLGFFTTPAFLSQWGNNASNSARAAANQTLIVALGEQIDGSDLLPLTTPSAVDPNHTADPACFSCHQTLDPLRQYFRQSYSLWYSPQDNPNQANIPAAFSFRGVTASGSGAAALGQILAQHPNLARAWVVKLCSWANSLPCRSDDPEVLRIADVFQRSNLNFQTMAKELFSSPIITYAAPTLTVSKLGQVTSIARQAQFCGTLEKRLNTTNLCNLRTAVQDGKNSISSRAAALPRDGYTRGSNAASYVTEPDPFYLGNIEGICALVAPLAIDGTLKWAASKDTNVAQRLAVEVMGVNEAQAAEPVAMLQKHIDAAVAAKFSRSEAVRSAFIAACSSSSSASIGQ